MRKLSRDLGAVLLLGGATLFAAGAAAGEVVVIQEGGGSITVKQNGATVYDRTVDGGTHLYADPPLEPEADSWWDWFESEDAPSGGDVFKDDPFFAD